MIHLDRNHHPSPLSPHANPNLILPTDQFKLLSRSPLAHDDKPVHQEAVPPNTTVDPDPSTVQEVVAKQSTPPVDDFIEPHSPAPVLPPSPAEAPAASPNGQRSSSLSPPPDSGSPKPVAATSPPVVPEETIEEPAPEPAPEPAEPSSVAPAEEFAAKEEDEAAAASPLSELSPPPEQEESSEEDKQDNTDEATSPAEVADADVKVDEVEGVADVENLETAEMTAEMTEDKVEEEEEEEEEDTKDTKDKEEEDTEDEEEDKEGNSNKSPTLEHTSPAAIPPQSPDAAAPSDPTPVPEADDKTTSTVEPMPTEPTANDDHPVASKSPTAAAKSPAKSPEKSPAPESSPPHKPRASSPQPSESNASSVAPAPSKDKGVRLLDLNVELLKVCMEFQAHSILMNEPRFQEYATRLQANLTWLANEADGTHQGNVANLTLPIMEAPVAVDFMSMERIQLLYADLPSIFAGEIARKQQLPHKAPSLPPSFPINLSLKRDRPDDAEPDIANKRRDTGESKSPPIRPPTVPPAPPVMNTSPISPNFPMSNSGSMGPGNLSQPSQMGPTPIAPPSLLHGLPSGPPTEAQIAASQRDRARQMHIQQAVRQQQQQHQQQQQQQHQQQQQQQHQQQQQQNVRQMSPPSTQATSQMPGQGQPHNAGQSTVPNTNFNASAAVAAFGPNAIQNIQILQNPSHPFMQYMMQNVPGFTTLPVPQQLQRMQIVQSTLQQQKQQHNRQPSGGSMPSMPQQGPVQGMQNNGMRGQQFPGQVGGATSPTNQPSIPQQQQQQQQQQQPPNGTFPLAQNQMNPGTNASTSQMMGGMGGMNINNLSPQQRQLLMMQHQQQQNQQQQMRAGGSGNPAMMNSEAYAMVQERSRQEQQQRLSHANSPPNAGSPPMSSSFNNDANSFPALRSNSAIPGIARSTRSPSDGAPSPMSPQMPRGPSQDMRRMVNPNMGGGMGQMPGFNQQMPNWQQKNQLGQQQQQSMPMGHLQPPNYGVQPGVNSFGGGPTSNQNWGYPLEPSLNSGGYQQPDLMLTSRHSSSTPAPQMHPQSSSPPTQHTSPNEFEMFNWGGGQ